MKKLLIVLMFFVTLPAFTATDNNGLEQWADGGVKTPFTEESNPRTSYEENSAIQTPADNGQFDSNGGVKMPFDTLPSSHSIYEDTAAIQSQPYFNDIDFAMLFFGLLGIGGIAIVLVFVCRSIDNMGTTKEDRQIQTLKVEVKEELFLIKNLVNSFQTAKDPEIAECVYALMTYRDERYNTSQIQAFLFPGEYQELIRNYILADLKKSINQLKLFKHKNVVLPVIWWHTLNSYISDENRQLMQELWTQLARGFELSRSKYLETSSKKFNFDNSSFFQIPKGMLNN